MKTQESLLLVHLCLMLALFLFVRERPHILNSVQADLCLAGVCERLRRPKSFKQTILIVVLVKRLRWMLRKSVCLFVEWMFLCQSCGHLWRSAALCSCVLMLITRRSYTIIPWNTRTQSWTLFQRDFCPIRVSYHETMSQCFYHENCVCVWHLPQF